MTSYDVERMAEPWTEVEEEGAVVITFDGIDAEKRDAAELAAFTRDLTLPPREDGIDEGPSESLWRFDNRRTRSPTALLRGMFYLLFGLATGYFAVWTSVAVAELFGVALGGLTQLILFYVGLLTPLGLAAYREWRSRAANRQAPPRDRFTLRLDSSGLSVVGERRAARTFDLDAIDGFEAGRRLAVRKRDGTREELACALAIAGDHGPLAGRLGEALMRARTATGGYRGAPRLRVSAEDVFEIEDDADSADRVARERR